MAQPTDPIRPPSAPADPGRPGLAIVANAPTPYRLHLHRRLARELGGVQLHSVFTHANWHFKWALEPPEEIGPVSFAVSGDESAARSWWSRPLRDFRKGGRVLRYLREQRIAAAIVMGYNSPLLMRLICRLPASGARLFVRLDSNIRGDRAGGGLKAPLKRAGLRWVFNRCDGVMPMGRLGRQYVERYGADPGRCFLVPYEPDYNLFASVDPADLARFRVEHGLSPHRKRIFFSGRLAAVKRVDLMLDAFGWIAGRRPDWDLLIAGDGPLADALRRRVPESLRGRVTWLGFREVDTIRLAYHASHALCLPSDYEPWGVVVNEAAAAGLPVIASDVVGAAHELVTDRVSGRLFRAGDMADLGRAMLDVTDPSAWPAYRDAVGPALEAWRQKADPVEGVRRALASVGIDA